MKKAFPFVAFLCFACPVLHAQELVIDPVLDGITVTNGILENSAYSDIKQNQTAIEAAQAATTASVALINQWQQKIYNGLLYVSSTVKNAYQVIECYQELQSIYTNESNMLSVGAKNPLAYGFAVKFEADMAEKALQYYSQIQLFILKEGDSKLLMDAGERTILMNAILDDLRAIDAYAANAYYHVLWAVQNGIINSLNPFASFVNRDNALVGQILHTYKF